MTLHPVVVGVDGSLHSERALAWAVDYAKLNGALLRIVGAWDLPPALGGTIAYADPAFYRQAAEGFVTAAVGLVPDGVRTECQVIEGHPAHVLTHESDDASLLVLGSRGRGGFADMMLGSVTDYCSHHARCPVVIVRGD
jgi:nucleotide-binding universal stress UspA family protein